MNWSIGRGQGSPCRMLYELLVVIGRIAQGVASSPSKTKPAAVTCLLRLDQAGSMRCRVSVSRIPDPASATWSTTRKIPPGFSALKTARLLKYHQGRSCAHRTCRDSHDSSSDLKVADPHQLRARRRTPRRAAGSPRCWRSPLLASVLVLLGIGLSFLGVLIGPDHDRPGRFGPTDLREDLGEVAGARDQVDDLVPRLDAGEGDDFAGMPARVGVAIGVTAFVGDRGGDDSP